MSVATAEAVTHSRRLACFRPVIRCGLVILFCRCCIQPTARHADLQLKSKSAGNKTDLNGH
ncbi:MAG: hypothetical protein IJQ29_08675 [Synergistaceae bacterium]|nr:hypothetical protein [Synergistaceae bacterium]